MKKSFTLMLLGLLTSLSVFAEDSVDVSSVRRLNRVSLSLGSVNLSYDGVSLSGTVKSRGCDYKVNGINNVSTREQGESTFVNIYTNVSSNCLPEGSERFYVDMIVQPSGKLELARLYIRQGGTNTYLAACGTYASLLAPGRLCEQ